MSLIKDIKDIWGATPVKIWIVLSCFASWVLIANIWLGTSSHETLTYVVDYLGSPGWGHELLNRISLFIQLHPETFHQAFYNLGIIVWILGSRKSSQYGFASLFTLEALASFVSPLTFGEAITLVLLWILAAILASISPRWLSVSVSDTAKNLAILPLLVVALPVIWTIAVFTGEL